MGAEPSQLPRVCAPGFSDADGRRSDCDGCQPGPVQCLIQESGLTYSRPSAFSSPTHAFQPFGGATVDGYRRQLFQMLEHMGWFQEQTLDWFDVKLCRATPLNHMLGGRSVLLQVFWERRAVKSDAQGNPIEKAKGAGI